MVTLLLMFDFYWVVAFLEFMIGGFTCAFVFILVFLVGMLEFVAPGGILVGYCGLVSVLISLMFMWASIVT